jgi:molecular chaperone HscB
LTATKFDLLGLPRQFDLDGAALDRAWRDRSRQVHPDRFARADVKDRMRALQAATALNDAHKTLRDPVKRAEYLLELSGQTVADGDRVDQGFLMEILELREALLDAKLAGETERLAAMKADMQARYDATMASIARLFAEHERTGDAGRLAEVKRELVALRYFRRFLDESEGRDSFDE